MQILLILFSLSAFATTEPFSEKKLIGLAAESSPNLSQIKTQLLSNVIQSNSLNEKYSPELFAAGSYSETQEKPIIAFLPVFSPIKQAQVGIRQRFSKGLEAQLKLATDQRSANSAVSGQYRDVTTNILSLTLQMDIWKDLFGALSEGEITRNELSLQRAKIEEEINKKALEISVRRIYWGLVANAEQTQIANRLAEDAQGQLVDSRRRLSKSIGDEGDVARYEAQLAQRKGQTLLFSYQRESLLKTLKTLIPSLNGKDVNISGYDIDKTIMEVSACAGVITSTQNIPWEFTRYDEVLKLLREQRSIERNINQRYSDMDVKLFGTVKSTGVGSDPKGPTTYQGSYGSAFDDMQTNNRAGYEVGVSVAIPLGSAKSETKASRILFDEEKMKAQIDGYDAQIASTHTELSKSMALIGQVMEAQQTNTNALKRRLKVVRQKYAHARVSVNDLLLDQDALLNSELSSVDVQLQILNVLFDYLMIFPDTPCSFNRI